ncbi:16S rRNA (guanine(966)-N(2))-methyltransferase RsmD [Sphingomonas swuensis]|uniref:16S rRNA (Guanine(966)-N(2))-methyltransferase RsmD n=1 Tax=Sphingomonas swuensis TaxID=977800 RepID=A0ABP7T3C0_9SPHN
MRIIAGQWRGRRLEAPPGLGTRPTADRTRETLFSMLVSRLGSFEGMEVADLFAGSGALALEAMSRGAVQATLVETDPQARKVIERNAALLGAEIRLAAHSALRLPVPSRPFDLVLADPPYESGSGTKVREAVEMAGWLAPGGWLAIETERGDAVAPGGFELDAERDVGRARITLLRAPA